MSTKTQTRGHCQCCGRIQAVRGAMSQHGYTVKHGWFDGVCHGHQFAPMETDRTQADRVIASVRTEVVDLLARIADLKAGKVHPLTIKTSRTEIVDGKRVPVFITWSDATKSQQQDAMSEAIWVNESRAKSGTQFADGHEALCNSVHGQPLQVVTIAAAAPRIEAGERRMSANGEIMVAKGQDGARVSWRIQRGDKSLNGWTGSKAWRTLSLAA